MMGSAHVMKINLGSGTKSMVMEMIKLTFFVNLFKLQQSAKFGFVHGIGFGETRDFIF